MSDIKTRICAFLMVVGVALIIGSLVVLGPGRFQVTSDGGITGTCSSVFAGPHGDMGNGDDGAQARSLAELRGQYDNGPSFDRLCNNERASRKHWMWGLVGLGVACIGGGRNGVLAYKKQSNTTEMRAYIGARGRQANP